MKDRNECDNHSWKKKKRRRRKTQRSEKLPSWNILELLPNVDLWDAPQHWITKSNLWVMTKSMITNSNRYC